MEVNSFQILVIDVTFYLQLDVLMKMKTRIYAAPAVKGLNCVWYLLKNGFLIHFPMGLSDGNYSGDSRRKANTNPT